MSRKKSSDYNKAISAISDGNIEELKKILKGKKPDFFTNPPWGLVSLAHMAIEKNNTDILTLLIKQGGINVLKQKNNVGETAAHWAVKNYFNDAFGLILEQAGVEVLEQGDRFGKTPVHFAGEWGRTDALELMIKKGGQKILEQRDKDRKTPAHWAARFGNEKTLALIVQEGGKEVLDQKDSEGKTPAHFAADGSYKLKTLQLILDQGGADVLKQKNALNQIPSHVAAEVNNFDGLIIMLKADKSLLDDKELGDLLRDKHYGQKALAEAGFTLEMLKEEQDQFLQNENKEIPEEKKNAKDYFSKESWYVEKQAILDKIFPNGAVDSADAEMALEHLVQHARHLLDRQNPTVEAQNKCDAIMQFMKSLKEVDSLQGAKELVVEKLRENPEDSNLTRYRPGFFNSYKNMSAFLFKLGGKSYGFEKKAVESRTGHYIVELADALSTEIEKQKNAPGL